MAERLHIEGWLVSLVELEARWSRSELPETVWLFRSPTGWTLGRMRRRVQYDDRDIPMRGSATVSAEFFSDLDQVGAYVERSYRSGSWVDVLDAGYDRDPDLYRAWVPERIQRDFQEASIYNRDLAEATGHFNPQSLPAAGRALPDWQENTLEYMATHLQELGFEVFPEQRDVVTGATRRDNPVLGGLRISRYGFKVAAVVRVDACGEVYVRLADTSEVAGPLFEPVSLGGDDEE